MNVQGFEVSTDKERLNVPWLLRELNATYWGHWYTMHQFIKAIDHSVCFGLYEGKAQVGFGRVISDFAATSTINDVIITSSHRGRGLGRMLMEAIVAHPSVAPTVCVLGTRDAPAFYRRFGFVGVDEQTKIFTRDPA